LKTAYGEIAVFNGKQQDNIDQSTVESFGDEWTKFSDFSAQEIESIGNEYFDVVPENAFGREKTALDMGCGSGRWSIYAARKFKYVEAIDPSDAVLVAQKQTNGKNIRVSKAGVDQIPFADESFDFVFSLGVLHHIPNTQQALDKSVAKLKKGGFFLLYLYYALDNRGAFYKAIFSVVNGIRKLISRSSPGLKRLLSDLIAIFIYLPLITFAFLLKVIGLSAWKSIPLNYYVGKSFFVIRNDALDRFGTPLEQRFSKDEIRLMMEEAGLVDIEFSNAQPFWHAIGKKVQ